MRIWKEKVEGASRYVWHGDGTVNGRRLRPRGLATKVEVEAVFDIARSSTSSSTIPHRPLFFKLQFLNFVIPQLPRLPVSAGSAGTGGEPPFHRPKRSRIFIVITGPLPITHASLDKPLKRRQVQNLALERVPALGREA